MPYLRVAEAESMRDVPGGPSAGTIVEALLGGRGTWALC